MASRSRLAGTDLEFYPLRALPKAGAPDPSGLPMTVKVLLEGLLRLAEAGTTREENVASLAAWPAYRWLVVGTVCIGAFMCQLDARIVTLALPRLGHDLHAAIGAVEWVALAYLLTLVERDPLPADVAPRKHPRQDAAVRASPVSPRAPGLAVPQPARTAPGGAAPPPAIVLALGALFTMTMVFARSRLAWFPLHPLGYLMAFTLPLHLFWFSIFVGWLAKSLITRFGGHDTVRKTTPLFLGLALGDVTMMLFWIIIDGWQGRTGHQLMPG